MITGADRIAANGDTANKIGTYSVATLARAHGIPFYVAAPTTTFDLSLATGDEIPIEQRAAEEITHGFGRQTAPAGVDVYNPAFDVTPAELITAIITDRGVIQPVNRSPYDAIPNLRSEAADGGRGRPACRFASQFSSRTNCHCCSPPGSCTVTRAVGLQQLEQRARGSGRIGSC